MKKQIRKYKNYIIPIIITIILSFITVSAGLYLSDSNSKYLQGSNNGNYTTMNESGVYFNNNKAFSRTADVVVCRGISALDDLIKSFTCDVVCKSTDSGATCAATIQTALNNNNIVQLDTGTFNTGAVTLNLSSNNQLLGSGLFNTIINYSGTTGSAIRNSNTVSGNQNIVIYNLGVNGNSQLSSDVNFGYGIRLDGVKNFIIDKVYVYNTKADAINMKATKSDGVNADPNSTVEGKIINSYFFNSSREGLQFEYGSHITIANNHFDYINSRGINFENYVEGGTSEDNIIVNNQFNHIGGGGIVIGNTNGVKIVRDYLVSHNTISNSIPFFGTYTMDVNGIQVLLVGVTMTVEDIIIDHNTVSNLTGMNSTFTADGIMYRATGDVKVEGNAINNIGRYGIYASSRGDVIDNKISNTGDNAIVTDSGGSNIKLNKIRNSNDTAIVIYNSKRTKVEGNEIFNTSTNAIESIISSANSQNGTIKNNYIWGSNTTYGIRALDAETVIENNDIFDAITSYNIDESEVYLDKYVYTSTPTCSVTNVFNNRNIYNSSGFELRCQSGVWNSRYINGTSDWTKIINFPVACPTGSYLTQLGSSTTCTSLIRTSGRTGQDLMRYYPANKDTLDYSGRGNNASLVGAAATNVSGKFGNGLSFVGNTADYLDVGNASDLNPNGNPFTISLWFNSAAATASQGLYSKDDGSARRQYSGIYMGNTNLVTCRVFNESTSTTVTSSGITVSQNSWYHYACSYNGSVITLYLNGASVATGNLTGSVKNGTTQTLRFGTATNNVAFNGTIDDIKIYNRSLSAEEVKADFESSTELTSQNSIQLKGTDYNPITNLFYNLGSSSLRWLKLWVQDIDSSGNITMSTNGTFCLSSDCLHYLKWNNTCITNGTTCIG